MPGRRLPQSITGPFVPPTPPADMLQALRQGFYEEYTPARDTGVPAVVAMAREDDAAALEYLIESVHADLDITYDGLTPLEWAVQYGAAETTEMLLAAGAQGENLWQIAEENDQLHKIRHHLIEAGIPNDCA